MHAPACFPASTQACRWVRPIPNAMVFIGIFSANRAVLRNLARNSACCQQVSSRNDEKEIFTHRCTLQIHWPLPCVLSNVGFYNGIIQPKLLYHQLWYNGMLIAHQLPTNGGLHNWTQSNKSRIKWQRSYWLIESPTCNIRCATCFNEIHVYSVMLNKRETY